ncbi:uncharacterized protein MYCFIDRAFT_175109 [Pseudocercospora fijiensis CIRAD86]|uniref:Uncharacterized protein n=1 Tax=Pseudocercospora fijiensis (strain CIRAD86) TaxID=383855 RepID=M2Z1I1_PSEFD|nr:uncharacterized protein MYCFIDRAFT_175109 [Pseudocercospora fijiensis CIRAD86]EME83685.1 hypothetical protein MYCFIDRAFT_175109 [Pseudocercospora fijiensis CIRAD86]
MLDKRGELPSVGTNEPKAREARVTSTIDHWTRYSLRYEMFVLALARASICLSGVSSD